MREKWQLVSAVCLERPPVITQAPTEMEQKFATLLSQIEYEGSYLSEFEMRHLDDL